MYGEGTDLEGQSGSESSVDKSAHLSRHMKAREPIISRMKTVHTGRRQSP